MGSYRIVILPIAQDDMKAIAAYIRQDDPEAAVRMVARIRESIGKLAEHPEMGPLPMDAYIARRGYRVLSIPPYRVFYVADAPASVVEVRRVLHSRQQPIKNI